APQPPTGGDRLRSKPLLDGAVDYALQPAAMDRELRNIMAGIEAARIAPDFLAVTGEVMQHVGADRDVVEFLQQPEAGEFADRMRQRVDADAELADGVGLLEQFAADAGRPQHQGHGQPPNPPADENGFHRPNSTLLNPLLFPPAPRLRGEVEIRQRRISGE